VKKVDQLLKRFDEVEALLGLPEILSDQKRYKELAQEHSYLNSVKEVHDKISKATNQLKENKELLAQESDPEFQAVIKEEIKQLEGQIESGTKELESLLVPPDPKDNANIILELRAGTGGDEAAIFVGDCVRMYRHYAVRMGWKIELLSASESEAGGYKEYIMAVQGPKVYRMLRFEAGAHRVQRVPATETQGRVHTSAITVAVLIEPDEEEDLHIDEADLKIDTYRASGAGGQHVNTTDSAVRITHIPTGVVVYSQEERSQHKNKAKAMRFLKAKIVEEQRRKAKAEISSERASQIGSGDRSERIRTYNYSQNRVTDHRINLTLYKLDQIMEGDLSEITEALVAENYARMLKGQS